MRMERTTSVCPTKDRIDRQLHYADRSSARHTPPVPRLVTRRMSGSRTNNHQRADRRSRIREGKQEMLLDAKHSDRMPGANDFHHRHTITVRQVCGREREERVSVATGFSQTSFKESPIGTSDGNFTARSPSAAISQPEQLNGADIRMTEKGRADMPCEDISLRGSQV